MFQMNHGSKIEDGALFNGRDCFVYDIMLVEGAASYLAVSELEGGEIVTLRADHTFDVEFDAVRLLEGDQIGRVSIENSGILAVVRFQTSDQSGYFTCDPRGLIVTPGRPAEALTAARA